MTLEGYEPQLAVTHEEYIQAESIFGYFSHVIAAHSQAFYLCPIT